MNNRIDHIKALERSLINETAGVSEFQMKSISKVINTLNFITNKEYDNLLWYINFLNSADQLIYLHHLKCFYIETPKCYACSCLQLNNFGIIDFQ